MKKTVILVMALSLVLLGTSAVFATPTEIDDVVSIVPYTASEQWVSGAVVGDGIKHDTIPGGTTPYDVKKVTVTSGNLLQIDLQTKFPAGGVGVWKVADIGLSKSGTVNAAYDAYTQNGLGLSVSPFEYGIKMSGYTGGTAAGGTGTATLYQVGTWSTTYSEVNAVPGTWGYGGSWGKSTTNPPYTAPVESRIQTSDSTALYSGTINWGNADAQGYFLVSILFNNMPLFYNTPFDLIWGTAICGNDIVSGPVDPQVPVPPSALLLGTGLLGLVGLGWRRRKSNA
jgi:hypothetical protein